MPLIGCTPQAITITARWLAGAQGHSSTGIFRQTLMASLTFNTNDERHHLFHLQTA